MPVDHAAPPGIPKIPDRVKLVFVDRLVVTLIVDPHMGHVGGEWRPAPDT